MCPNSSVCHDPTPNGIHTPARLVLRSTKLARWGSYFEPLFRFLPCMGVYCLLFSASWSLPLHKASTHCLHSSRTPVSVYLSFFSLGSWASLSLFFLVWHFAYISNAAIYLIQCYSEPNQSWSCNQGQGGHDSLSKFWPLEGKVISYTSVVSPSLPPSSVRELLWVIDKYLGSK